MTSFSKRLMPCPKNRLKDGVRIQVAIRVIHQRKIGYMPTGVDIGCTMQKDGTFVPNWIGEVISPAEPEWLGKNKVVDDYCKEVREKYVHLINPGLMSLKELMQNLATCDGRGRAATLETALADYAENRKGTVSDDYLAMVRHSVERLSDWLKGDTVLRKISPEMIKSYARFLRTSTKQVVAKKAVYSPLYKQIRYDRTSKTVPLLSEASIGKELSHIKAVLNFAEDEGLVKYDIRPFSSVQIRRSGAKETDVEPHDVVRLRDSAPDTRAKQLAKDVFMLSFYLGGMNYKDILAADFSQDVVTYCREKTKSRGIRRTVKVPIQPEAREILDRYTKDGRWVSGLNYSSSRDEIGYIGKKLAQLVKELGLPPYMTFYSARKSFAQFALDIGIVDAVTDYLMGHAGDGRGVISYYSRVTPRMAGIALRKVIDYMGNPTSYQADIERAILS